MKRETFMRVVYFFTGRGARCSADVSPKKGPVLLDSRERRGYLYEVVYFVPRSGPSLSSGFLKLIFSQFGKLA